MDGISVSEKKKFENFVKKYLNGLDKNKPFNISSNKISKYISRKHIDKMHDLKSKEKKEGGFIQFLLPLLGGLFGGSGFDFSATETKHGGFLGAFMKGFTKVLPWITKGVKSLLKIAPAAVSVAGLVQQGNHNKNIQDAVRGNGIFLQPYKGEALGDILNQITDKFPDYMSDGKKQIKDVLNTLGSFFKIFKSTDGKGIFLQPRQ